MNSLQRFNLLIGALWGKAESISMMMHEVVRDAEGQPLLLGVDRQSQRLIFTPVNDAFAFIPQRGASIELAEWRHAGSDQRYLVVRSSADGLAEVFGAFSDNVIQRVKSGARSEEAILGALQDWRSLFKPAHELSKDSARGLFGELWLLKQVAKLNPHVAIDRWTGPDDAPHDFMSADRHVEVKTSEKEGAAVTVSSLSQLDTVGEVPLALVKIRVRSQPEGQNIESMIDELTRLGCFRADLLQKLSRVGFILGADPDRNRFTVVDDPSVWEVSEGFPGLRSHDIPQERREAITQVKYTLDLLAAPGRLTMRHEFDAILHQLVAQ